MKPALQLSLQFADKRHRALLPRHRVMRWMRAALDAPAQIAVRVVDADEGRALNRDWRGKDYATNVLTFAYDDEAAPPAGLGAPEYIRDHAKAPVEIVSVEGATHMAPVEQPMKFVAEIDRFLSGGAKA